MKKIELEAVKGSSYYEIDLNNYPEIPSDVTLSDFIAENVYPSIKITTNNTAVPGGNGEVNMPYFYFKSKKILRYAIPSPRSFKHPKDLLDTNSQTAVYAIPPTSTYSPVKFYYIDKENNENIICEEKEITCNSDDEVELFRINNDNKFIKRIKVIFPFDENFGKIKFDSGIRGNIDPDGYILTDGSEIVIKKTLGSGNELINGFISLYYVV